LLSSGSARVFLACLGTQEVEKAKDWASKPRGHTEMTTQTAAVPRALPWDAESKRLNTFGLGLYGCFITRREELAASPNEVVYGVTASGPFVFPL